MSYNRFLYLTLFFSLVSCGSSKKVTTESVQESDSSVKEETAENVAEKVAPSAEVVKADSLSFDVKGIRFNMVKVKGGSFRMGGTPEQGSDAFAEEKPVHTVKVADFLIGQTEVTQALWSAVMGNNPSGNKDDNRPVACVTWNACHDFINKLNALTGKQFRLPTEAEWEYAARGGEKSAGFKYSGSNVLSEVGECDQYSRVLYFPVASKKPNELGIYDMSGNVAEWCEDWFGMYGASDQVSPTGPKTGEVRIIRGGGGTLGASSFRVSARDGGAPERWFNHVGLRLVLSE